MTPFAWLKPAAAGLGAVVKSYLTGPDGTSYAPGRLFAFATFVIAQGLVVGVAAALLPVLRHVSDWMTFFAAVAAFQGATGATCIALARHRPGRQRRAVVEQGRQPSAEDPRRRRWLRTVSPTAWRRC